MGAFTTIRKSKPILARWQRALLRFERNLHPKVLAERQRILTGAKKNRHVSIWLGGPCPEHSFYKTRWLLRAWLRSHGYDVQFSERWGSHRDLVASELTEVEVFDFIVVLVVSMGTAAEAVEFAHMDGTVKGKLRVYFPEEHVGGYLYRTLTERHRVTTKNELFKLRATRRGNPTLALKVYESVLNFQIELERRKRTKREFALHGIRN